MENGSKLLVELRKTHKNILLSVETLADMRYKANSSERPTRHQMEKAIESAYWRLSNTANELLPYISALALLQVGEE